MLYLPSPLFAKEGDIASLWQREVRRDFLNNVVTHSLLVTDATLSSLVNLKFSKWERLKEEGKGSYAG